MSNVKSIILLATTITKKRILNNRVKIYSSNIKKSLHQFNYKVFFIMIKQ